jgi:two-component system response regulator HydG
LDVRIIIATNENLQDSIQKGRFREDLYHRFNEFSIYIPPLRERGTDIILLAEHFLKIANHELGRNVLSFSPEVLECFMNYRWQGNIREMKNVVRRATLLTEGEEISMKALPLEISNFKIPVYEYNNTDSTENRENRHDLKNAALEAEYETILKVLREVNFNKTKAAEMLNIDRKTLYNKMKAINLK